jgi:preprotein translocase subunit SecE
MAEGKKGIIGGTTNYFAEVKQELKKVTWPTKGELYGATIVVVVVTILLSFALGVTDMTMSYVLEHVMAKSI